MRILALDYLMQELAGETLPSDPQQWYKDLRKNSPEKLFPFLVEDSGKIERVYVLSKISEAEDTVTMTVQDIINDTGADVGCTPDRLPFMKPAGSQSAQVGPVFKRSYDRNKGGGPSAKILKTTMSYFNEVSESNKDWSPYFKEMLNVLACSKLRLNDGSDIYWKENGYVNLLECAVDKIGSQSGTVFLTVLNSEGKFPGEVAEYISYLLNEKLAGERYVTGKALARDHCNCPLCNVSGITVYPNALKGAGINLKNIDRTGMFPGIAVENAWKGYALCGACADLLYIYKHHVIKKGGPNKDRQFFGARIAGESAIIIPVFLPGIEPASRRYLLIDVNGYIVNATMDVSQEEDSLLDILKDEKSILNLIILWADVGQNLENVTGMINSVLPSRLRELSRFNQQSIHWNHPLFPTVPLRQDPNDFRPDLALKALKPLFFRPGGRKSKDVNASKRLFQLKKHLASNVYHRTSVLMDRFEEEILITARWHWLEITEKKDGYRDLLNEGIGKNGPYLTTAGWIKHVHWWMYYFKQVGVMKMEKQFYEPQMDELKAYFGPESGIDTPEKAYSFLLGVLYGKLLQVQGARGINVGANALSWLKRLTLKGSDLPELYNKIRAKLLAYETEKNEKVRNLVTEIGTLGIKLGDNIVLSEVQTNYYLLLGQSMTNIILPKQEKESDKK